MWAFPSGSFFFNPKQFIITNFILFYDWISCLVNEGKAASLAYPDLNKIFDTVSHSVLLRKLAAHGLNR